MTTRLTEDPIDPPADTGPEADLSDRLLRLEGEVVELRNTLSELAEIVVGDIRDRREAAIAASAPVVPDIPIPASLVPGGQTTVTAINTTRRPWLLIDLFREIGTTVRMYMDARYRVRRATQLMVPLVVGLLVANYFFFNFLFPIPVAAEILERLIAIILAVLLYKVLTREVGRYRQTVAQIAANPRSWKAVPLSVLHNDPDTAAVSRQESP